MSHLQGCQFPDSARTLPVYPSLPVGRRSYEYLPVNDYFLDQKIKYPGPVLYCFTSDVIPTDPADVDAWAKMAWSKCMKIKPVANGAKTPVEIWNEPNFGWDGSHDRPQALAKLYAAVIALARKAKRSDFMFLSPAISTVDNQPNASFLEMFLAALSKADLTWLGVSFHFYPSTYRTFSDMMTTIDALLDVGKTYGIPDVRFFVTELGSGLMMGGQPPSIEIAANTLRTAKAALFDCGILLMHCWVWCDTGFMNPFNTDGSLSAYGKVINE